MKNLVDSFSPLVQGAVCRYRRANERKMEYFQGAVQGCEVIHFRNSELPYVSPLLTLSAFCNNTWQCASEEKENTKQNKSHHYRYFFHREWWRKKIKT